jgi:TPP-dependent 2-oxoacid decarboxylase
MIKCSVTISITLSPVTLPLTKLSPHHKLTSTRFRVMYRMAQTCAAPHVVSATTTHLGTVAIDLVILSALALRRRRHMMRNLRGTGSGLIRQC